MCRKDSPFAAAATALCKTLHQWNYLFKAEYVGTYPDVALSKVALEGCLQAWEQTLDAANSVTQVARLVRAPTLCFWRPDAHPLP